VSEADDAGPTTPGWTGDGADDPGTEARPHWATYGTQPYAVAPPPPPTQRPVVEIADLWTVVLGTVGVLLVGVVTTAVWVWVAPRVIAVKQPGGGVGFVASEPKGFAGADVAFLAITAAAGLLCAGVAALVARRRGLAVTVAMAGGGFLASWLTAWFGRLLTGGPAAHWVAHATVNAHQHYFIELQTRPFVMAWPVVALVVTFFVALATPDEPAPPAA
jgi:hypothetical protein